MVCDDVYATVKMLHFVIVTRYVFSVPMSAANCHCFHHNLKFTSPFISAKSKNS